MTKLEELLEQLCPNEVEHKTLGEIATDIYRGSGIKRTEVTQEGIPCVRYGEIYTTYNIWFDKCVSHTKIGYVKSPKYFEHGDILFAITGENVEEIAKSIAYLGNEKCLAGGDIVILKHEQNPKYMAYALSTVESQKQKSAGRVKSKVVHSNVPSIKSIVIPVPPLEIQAEIVRILDNFTEQVAELKDNLSAELSARKKQYEYYRDGLLSFSANIKRTKLSELVSFRNGKGHEKCIVNQGKYIVVNSKFISTNGEVVKYSNEQICPLYIDDILMVMSDLPNGRALAKCFLVEENDKYTLNQRIGAFHVNSNEILTKFLLYTLNRNKQLLKYDNGVDQTNLRKNDILDITISVPPIKIQNRIVDVLDNFEAICSDLNITLPAEIEARQKQYEYYRDLLLTFAETGGKLADRQTDRQTDRQAEIALLQYVFGFVVLPLTNVFDIKNGYTPSKKDKSNWTDGDIPWFRLEDIRENGRILSDAIQHITPNGVKNTGLFKKNSIMLSTTATLGEHALILVDYLSNQQITNFSLKDEYNDVFLVKFAFYYFYLLKDKLTKIANYSGGIPIVDQNKLRKLTIAIPSIKEQKRIVAILDRFDKLCNDITEGLPAEIEARQKQYEYYRDKLLSFKETKKY